MRGPEFVPTRSLRTPLFAASLLMAVLWVLILGPVAWALGLLP